MTTSQPVTAQLATQPIQPAPTKFSIPYVRPDNPAANKSITIAPTPGSDDPTKGYQGCIVLFPQVDATSGINRMQVVLYVDQALGVNGINWTPPASGAMIVDVPIGFNIGNGDVLTYWIGQYRQGGGAGTGPAMGHP